MEGKQQRRKRTLASSIMDEEAVKQLRAWYQDQQHAQALLEELATRRGVTLTYTIGQKMDRYGMGKRGDPPGVDFDM